MNNYSLTRSSLDYQRQQRLDHAKEVLASNKEELKKARKEGKDGAVSFIKDLIKDDEKAIRKLETMKITNKTVENMLKGKNIW